VTVLEVTENVAEVEPSGTVTEAGTFASFGETLSAISAPPLFAGEVRATLQVDPAEGVRDVGLQDTLLKRGVWRIVTVPPLAEVAIPAPAESAEMLFVSWTDEDVSSVESARVKVSEAITLFGIVAELSPHTKHVAVPEPLLQESDLLAAAAAAAKLADLKSVVEYLTVHSVESGIAPVALKERFNTTDAPGTPEPEERLRATPWAKP
jgi:hypothetical protein